MAKAKTAKTKNKKLTANDVRALADALKTHSAIAARADIAARMGKSFGDDRELYTALGYTTSPTFNDYMAKYLRQDIARAVIDAPVRACWRKPPIVTESEEDETKFETMWAELADEKSVWHHFARADRLAGIGTYSAILLGFDDSLELGEPVGTAKRLLYIAPYSMANATIAEYEEDATNERYGLPKTYSINTKATGTKTGSTSKRVHYSRVIHVAEDLLEDNVEGLPKLQGILNRLYDLEKVAGGSAEMFWRGAYQGLAFIKQPDATIGTQDVDDLETELEEYLHGLKRYMRLEGMEIQELAPNVADPEHHVSVLLDLVSAATRIPKRILMGTERGELASTQDEKNWNNTVDSRRREHCEPTIVRPFVDRCIEAGVLPEPVEGYTLDWPDLAAPGDKEMAEVGLTIAQALKAYSDATVGAPVVHPEVFLEKCGFTPEDIAKNQELIEPLIEEFENAPEPEPVEPPPEIPLEEELEPV